MSSSSIILGILTITAYTLSLLGFLGKGMIIDDHYVFSSKEKRQDMNKSAYQLQSAIVFLGVGTMFLLYFFRLLSDIASLYYIAIAIGLATMVYAIISHYVIRK